MKDIEIKKASYDELPILEKYLGKESIPWFHREKLEFQESGKGIWLIAWGNDVPVGYIQVRWTGDENEQVRSQIKNCAHLESAGVIPEKQGKGIGSKLILEAEKQAKDIGFNLIGLAVGSTDNPRAKKLYERLGYIDWGHGDFTASWKYIDNEGQEKTETELCTYLIKNI